MQPRAHPREMGVSGESTFPPGSGRWDSPLFAPQAGQALPGPGGGGGERPVRRQENQGGAPKTCRGGAEAGGNEAVCEPWCAQPVLPCGRGGKGCSAPAELPDF